MMTSAAQLQILSPPGGHLRPLPCTLKEMGVEVLGDVWKSRARAAQAGRCAELVKGLWKLGGDGITEEG